MKYKIALALTLIVYKSLSQQVKVARVIDGDTFVTEHHERVRLIGINAPEQKDFFGKESKEYLANLIEGKTVFLAKDHLVSDKDRYGRLLRYTLLGVTDINKKMIQEGFAFAYLTYGFEKEAEYENEQLKSKDLKKGIWRDPESSPADNLFKETIPSKNPSVKGYVILGLVLALILIGVYSYFRR